MAKEVKNDDIDLSTYRRIDLSICYYICYDVCHHRASDTRIHQLRSPARRNARSAWKFVCEHAVTLACPYKAMSGWPWDPPWALTGCVSGNVDQVSWDLGASLMGRGQVSRQVSWDLGQVSWDLGQCVGHWTIPHELLIACKRRWVGGLGTHPGRLHGCAHCVYCDLAQVVCIVHITKAILADLRTRGKTKCDEILNHTWYMTTHCSALAVLTRAVRGSIILYCVTPHSIRPYFCPCDASYA